MCCLESLENLIPCCFPVSIMGTVRWITIVCCACVVLPGAAQTPPPNQPQAQLIFEGGSGSMTSQLPDSAAGVAANFDEVLPALAALPSTRKASGIAEGIKAAKIT